MVCLAIDASGAAASVAVVQNDKLLYEAMLIREKAHASELAPMAQEALCQSCIDITQVDAIACVSGPGSFTGVRIGVALAQGVALMADKPCCAVDALETLAYPHRFCGRIVCPILDARAGQVYGAAFFYGQRVLDDLATSLEDFLDRVTLLGDSFFFVGEGVGVYRAAIVQALGNRAVLDTHGLIRASDAAYLALENRDAWLPAEALHPFYLRVSQAEREKLRHGRS